MCVCGVFVGCVCGVRAVCECGACLSVVYVSEVCVGGVYVCVLVVCVLGGGGGVNGVCGL